MVYVIDYNIDIILCVLKSKKKKNCITHFIEIFPLLQQSRMKPTVSLRSAYKCLYNNTS